MIDVRRNKAALVAKRIPDDGLLGAVRRIERVVDVAMARAQARQ